MEEVHGNSYINTTSDQYQYMTHVNDAEKDVEVDIINRGDDDEKHQQQYRISSISTSHHSNQYQNIVDTNDMMMLNNTSSLHYYNYNNNTTTSPIHHRYVLTDDEVEQSLQELDDTIASLDGTANKQQQQQYRHRRTHTAGSSTPGSHGVSSSTTTVIDESSSISSSVHTERTHAVLIHRQLIDNMETLSSYHYRNQNHHTSRHKKRSNNGGGGGGTSGKSISSRVSTNSRRSKLSNAQQSYMTYRSHTGCGGGGGSTTGSSRPPRGPSLERVIFQTLLHAARSDTADVHFIRRTDEDDDDNDDNDNNDDTKTNNNNEEDDEANVSTESILKDLIQADAILSVEVGNNQSISTRNIDDCNNVIDYSGHTVQSITNEINNNPCLLLPPIATEEEPELLSTSTTHQQHSQPQSPQKKMDQSIPSQPLDDDDEWEPDFDAITFPTTCGGTTTYLESSTLTDPISSAVVQGTPTVSSSKNTSTAGTATTSKILSTTITSIQHNQQYLSKDDSPESDIFDQIGDSYDDTLSFFDDKNINDVDTNNNNNNNNNTPVQNVEKSLLRPIVGPTVKVYVNTNNNNSNSNNNGMQPYYDDDNDASVVGSTSSWGVFDTPAIKRPTPDDNYYHNDVNDNENYNNPCYDPFFTSLPTNTTTTITAIEKRHSPRSDVLTIPTNPTSDESIFFPTVLQDKPSTATTTTSSPPINDNYDHRIQQRYDNDQWMIFDKNPFASRNTEQSSSLSSHFVHEQQQLTEVPNFFVDQTMNNHNNNNDTFSNNSTSQDNVSVSSPASVVQFVQIVDRCPSNKSSSDTNNNNNNNLPFDTKCSF